MEHRRRRTVQSSLGRIDLGEVKEQGVLMVDDPEDREQEQPVTRQWNAGPEPDINDVEQQIEQARAQRHASKQRATKAAMQRLEVLVGIGRLTKDVVIDNITFSLRSLKSREIQNVMEKAVAAQTNIGEAIAIRNNTLGYAVYQIDGQPLSVYVQSKKIEDAVDLIGELEESVVLQLWDQYSDMLSAHNDNLPKDLGKTADEQIDNIKKS